jgi:hypothetical protein
VEIIVGTPHVPYLKEINSELKSINYDNAKKQYSFTSERKNISTIIISPLQSVSLSINGIIRNDLLTTIKQGSVFIISITQSSEEKTGIEKGSKEYVHFSLSF